MQKIFQITGAMGLDKGVTTQPVGIYEAQTLAICDSAANSSHVIYSALFTSMCDINTG